MKWMWARISMWLNRASRRHSREPENWGRTWIWRPKWVRTSPDTRTAGKNYSQYFDLYFLIHYLWHRFSQQSSPNNPNLRCRSSSPIECTIIKTQLQLDIRIQENLHWLHHSQLPYCCHSYRIGACPQLMGEERSQYQRAHESSHQRHSCFGFHQHCGLHLRSPSNERSRKLQKRSAFGYQNEKELKKSLTSNIW